MIFGFSISLLTAFLINRIAISICCYRTLFPRSIYDNVYRNWKWRNFLISFIHAIITGIGSLICVWIEPRLINDVINIYMEFAYIITCFSHGYFIYDTIEMVKYIQYKGCKELVVHHIMILMCFSITVIEHKYVGYNCIALLIELSNIFLHLRQLLIIAGIKKTSLIYKINSIINIASFVTIRGMCMYWLWHTLYLSFNIVPIIIKSIASLSLIGITIITTILLRRLIISDFISYIFPMAKYTNALNF